MIISERSFSDVVPGEIRACKTWVIGLSGGADSLCLTLLARSYAAENGTSVVAGIVDHKLRPESSSEILPTIDILKKMGIEYEVLVWDHPFDIGGSIELKARHARYNLLYKLCKSVSGDVLLTAHHAMDQWETFFMRLSRGSSIRGLVGIRNVSEFKDIKLFRPLLKFSPGDIKQTLRDRFGVLSYVNDPSNHDSKFERVRWRRAYKVFADRYHLDMDSIGKSIERLQVADDCLNQMAQAALADVFDGACIAIETFRKLHCELRMRVLDMIIKAVSPKDRRIISYGLLRHTINDMCRKEFVATNLSGLVLRKQGGNSSRISISVENRP
ncbi:MAG: tRNA lysidine(34) synthetase TilS [Holosporales bacterium]|jgi:tRNA(Ile)-lysidine synthase|nr:tRNA lysidine(34) synthetase TilS [Holosporales bacterium]